MADTMVDAGPRATNSSLATLVQLASLPASAADSVDPERPIRLIISSAAGGSPEQFAAFVKKETVKWADVVKKSGAKLD